MLDEVRKLEGVGKAISARATALIFLFVLLNMLSSPILAGEGDSVTVGRIVHGASDAITGKGESLGRLADLEDEARQRVLEALASPLFIVEDDSGSFLPAPLSRLMRIAADKNPSVDISRSKVAVMGEKVLPAGARKEPKVGFMLMNHPLTWPWETRIPMTQEKLSVSQMFESYGKRHTRRKIAEFEVKISEISVDEAEYAIEGMVINVYFDLLANAVNIEMLDRREALLDVMLEIARVRYELNKAPLSDVLAVETRLAKIGERRANLNVFRGVLTARLAGLLGIPESELEFELEVVDSYLEVDGIDREALWLSAWERHPALSRLDAWDGSLFERLRLAEKNYHPDYTLQFDYGFRPNHTDFVSFGVMFNLPVYKLERQDPKYREIAALREQVPIMEEALLNRIRSEGGVELSKLELIGERIERYRRELIPLAESSFDAALAGYQVERTGFAELIKAEVNLLDYETEYKLALVEAARARARLFHITIGAISTTSERWSDDR